MFYHGSGDYGFEEFKYGNDELGKQGFYFSSSKEVANTYNIWDENPIYEVFLNIKNPYIADFKGNAYNSKFGHELLNELVALNLPQKYDGVIFKNIRDEAEQGSGKIADTIVVFNPRQIKEVKNRGVEGKYFNEDSSNIYSIALTIR